MHVMGRNGRPPRGDRAVGVRWNKGGWEARLKGEIYLGRFASLLDAAAAVISQHNRAQARAKS